MPSQRLYLLIYPRRMLIFLLTLLLTVSAAAPKEKHPKWAAHPDIQCSMTVVTVGTALLVSKTTYTVMDYKVSYPMPFSKQP